MMDYVRHFMIRVILADSFIDLKVFQAETENEDCPTTDADDQFGEDEMTLLSFIETQAMQCTYRLPRSKGMRYKLYDHFFNYNICPGVIPQNDLNCFSSADDIDILRMVNPFFRLD